MPLIFPSNPSLNQVFDNGTFSFIWNGSSWVANGSPPSADLTINSANSAGSYANGAFAAANSAGNYANAAFLVANTSANVNTTQNTNISFAWNHANAAFNVANSSITTNPGTTGNVLTSNGNNWISQAAAAGGGDYIMQVFTSPGTWTKPAGLKAVKVTVVGAGGNGGSGVYVACPFQIWSGGNGGGGGGAILYLDAPAVPGPITVTVGTAPSKTSSFGPLVSATGGTNGSSASPTANAPTGPYAGGTGSGGTINITGQSGNDIASSFTGMGGASALGLGVATPNARSPLGSGGTAINGISGVLYGGGATGGRPSTAGSPGTAGTGAAGIVIVEEFY